MHYCLFCPKMGMYQQPNLRRICQHRRWAPQFSRRGFGKALPEKEIHFALVCRVSPGGNSRERWVKTFKGKRSQWDNGIRRVPKSKPVVKWCHRWMWKEIRERAVYSLKMAASDLRFEFFFGAGSIPSSMPCVLRLLGFPAFTLDGTSAMGGALVEGKILGESKVRFFWSKIGSPLHQGAFCVPRTCLPAGEAVMESSGLQLVRVPVAWLTSQRGWNMTLLLAWSHILRCHVFLRTCILRYATTRWSGDVQRVGHWPASNSAKTVQPGAGQNLWGVA